MTRRSGIWRGMSAGFTAVNLVGLGMAATAGEAAHGVIHVGLSLLGALGVWWFAPDRQSADQQAAELSDARLEQLQQSIDAIALEVERIGEAQRFHTRLQAEQSETRR